MLSRLSKSSYEELGVKSTSGKKFLDIYKALLTETGNQTPSKTSITPERFSDCLGHVFIVERNENGFWFRLFGTYIVDTVGTDLRNRYLHEYLEGDDLEAVSTILNQCLDLPCIAVSHERVLGSDKQYWEVAIIRAPFVDETGAHRFVAGTFDSIGASIRRDEGKIISASIIRRSVERKTVKIA